MNHELTASVLVRMEAAEEFLTNQIDGAIESRGHDQEITRHIGTLKDAATLLAAYAEYRDGLDRALKPLFGAVS